MPSAARTASLLGVLLLSSCQTTPGGPVPTAYRAPLLETVAQAGAGLHIVPQGPDGSYSILPNGKLLRFRVQGDVNVKVQVNGVDLPRRTPAATPATGWQEPVARTLRSGSRKLFWDIAVMPPDSVLQAGVTSFRVTLASDTVRAGTHPTTEVLVRLRGTDAAFDAASPAPSAVFVGNTHNTKGDNRMETGIVARGVTLAGWLSYDPGANEAGLRASGASEDFHYDIHLDPDFIERNYGAASETYGPTVLVEPLASAVLPGNVAPSDRGLVTPIRLLSQDPSLPTRLPTAAALTLPGNGNFAVELNAWHTFRTARGPKPSGWFDDPDPQTFPANAWAFPPRLGVLPPSSDALKGGDYVILSGTLWEDSAHAPNVSVRPEDFVRRCFDTRFKGHAGWLEIHPVDAVRRVDGPALRKHVVGLSACNPGQPRFTMDLEHPLAAPDENHVLRFEVLVDPRFTTANATFHTEKVDCEPPRLRVTADVPSAGSYSATYVLWWEKTQTKRPPPDSICIPAAGPVLGPVYKPKDE